MSAADDVAVDHEHRADWDSAFGEPCSSFVDRDFEEWVQVET
jgi:hypothetical protein